MDREAWRAVIHGFTKSRTRRSDWTELNICRAICQCCCCSVTKLCLTLCDPTDCRIPGFPALHHLPELAQAHVHWVWWCHPTILSSVIPFFSCLQSFPASGSFLMSQLFASGRQSIGASASASVLPTNSKHWFPLGLTSLISLQAKGLSRVFSSITIQKHQFFSIQPSLWSKSHICTWLLEKQLWVYGLMSSKWCLCFLICCPGLS